MERLSHAILTQQQVREEKERFLYRGYRPENLKISLFFSKWGPVRSADRQVVPVPPFAMHYEREPGDCCWFLKIFKTSESQTLGTPQ